MKVYDLCQNCLNLFTGNDIINHPDFPHLILTSTQFTFTLAAGITVDIDKYAHPSDFTHEFSLSFNENYIRVLYTSTDLKIWNYQGDYFTSRRVAKFLQDAYNQVKDMLDETQYTEKESYEWLRQELLSL